MDAEILLLEVEVCFIDRETMARPRQTQVAELCQSIVLKKKKKGGGGPGRRIYTNSRLESITHVHFAPTPNSRSTQSLAELVSQLSSQYTKMKRSL